MRRDVLAAPLHSSFLSCERDTETILRKLFIDSKQHGKTLKRLLVISNNNCLADATNPDYLAVEAMSLKQLLDNHYVILSPKIENEEYAKLKTAIVINFNNFIPNKSNPEFRDCQVEINVICNLECWELTDYQLRPYKILGYIDGILNNTKLSGIGELEFSGCAGPVIRGDVGMFTMTYRAVHGSDDRLPDDEYHGDI